MKIINTFLDIVIPITTFLIAVIALYFTAHNFFQKKANLKLFLVSNAEVGMDNNELLVDRKDDKTPDPYANKPYRFIPTVNLVNASSQPITIFEIRLSDKVIYNSYTQTGEVYIVTFNSTNMYDRDRNKLLNVSEKHLMKNIGYVVGEQAIKMPLTLAPLEAATGCIVFSYEMELKGHATIYLVTSRGTFKYNVSVGKLITADNK